MKRLKRLMLASVGMIAIGAVLATLLTLSAVVVWFGTGADPSDAFNEPELLNSSLTAERNWNDRTVSGELSTLEATLLTDAWADAFALLERRSNGETVDLERRFHPDLAAGLASAWPTTEHSSVPVAVLRHDITIELVSTNRQVVALTVDVTLDRTIDGSTISSTETYESVMVNGLSGWTVVTFNRTGATFDALD